MVYIRWRGVANCVSPRRVREYFAFCALLAVASSSLGAPNILFAGGGWAALDRGGSCEALTRSVLIAPKGRVQATAGFSFSANRRQWGEFHARLSRIPRPGSSVMLNIGSQPFLLVARGQWAWSRGPAQEQAIIAASRKAPAMRIEARDGTGRRFADSYGLGGAPTAIDAAAAACAGKSR